MVENHVELDKLWNMLTDISKLGKLLMRKDKAKAEDYMLTNVLTKVRKVPTKSVNQKKVTPPVAAQTPTAEAKKKEEEPQVEKVQ